MAHSASSADLQWCNSVSWASMAGLSPASSLAMVCWLCEKQGSPCGILNVWGARALPFAQGYVILIEGVLIPRCVLSWATRSYDRQTGSEILFTTGKRHSFFGFFMFLEADVHNQKYVPRRKN
jgi:hypothetical protein